MKTKDFTTYTLAELFSVAPHRERNSTMTIDTITQDDLRSLHDALLDAQAHCRILNSSLSMGLPLTESRCRGIREAFANAGWLLLQLAGESEQSEGRPYLVVRQPNDPVMPDVVVGEGAQRE